MIRILVASLFLVAVVLTTMLAAATVSGAPAPPPTASAGRLTMIAAGAPSAPSVCPVLIEPLAAANEDGETVEPSTSGTCRDPAAAPPSSAPGTGGSGEGSDAAAASQSVSLEILLAPHH